LLELPSLDITAEDLLLELNGTDDLLLELGVIDDQLLELTTIEDLLLEPGTEDRGVLELAGKLELAGIEDGALDELGFTTPE